MSGLLTIPSTGLATAQAAMADTAAVIANQNTPGFGAPETLSVEGGGQPGRASSAAIGGVLAPGRLGLSTGSVVLASPVQFGSGWSASSVPTHLALTGSGFFVVKTPSGATAYTRAGAFAPNANGQLTLPDGSTLVPPVTLPKQGTWSIAHNGAVTVNGTVVAHITVARFANPGGLMSAGSSLWLANPSSGAARLVTPGQGGSGLLQTGALNTSGVSLNQAMTSLIQVQAQYQANADALKVGQQALNQLTSQPL